MADPEIKVKISAESSAAVSTVEQFNQRLTRATEAYNQVAGRSKVAADALAKAFDKAALSGATFVEAMEQSVAATKNFGLAADQVVVKTHSMTSNFYAAQGASRLFEGQLPIRAMERFLASSETVGAVLSAAFPVIGIIAVGEVLIHAAESAYQAYEKFIDLDGAFNKLAQDAEKLRDKDFIDVRSIETADERLQKANQSATQLRETAESLHETSLKALFVELAQGNVGAAAVQAGLLRSAREFADQSVHATEQSVELGLKRLEIEHQMNTLQIEAQHARDGVLQGEAKINAQLAEQLALHRENAQFERKREKALGNPAPADAGSRQQSLEDEISRGRAASEIANLKTKGNTEAAAAARQAIQEAREQLRALEADTRAQQEQFNAFAGDQAKQQQRSFELERKQEEESLRNYRDKARALAEATQYAEAEAQAQRSVAEAQIAAAQASGGLSQVAADEARAAANAEYYRQRIEDLKNELAQLVPYTQEYLRVQRQLSQVQGQAQVSKISGDSKTAQDMASPYMKAVQTVNQAWLEMQNKLIFGTRNVRQAFANMGVSMLESVAASFEKMLVRQLQYEIQSRIAHQISNQTKLASDASAAAAGQALTRESALKEEFVNAKAAAVAAFKGVMNVVPPPLNFVLAPVAAGAAFAGALAVGAFEKGGIITGPTMALMGESGSEAVLPHKLTTMLMNVANNNGGNTTTSNVNSTANFNGITDRNFRDMARRHSDVIAESVHRSIRSGRARLAS